MNVPPPPPSGPTVPPEETRPPPSPRAGTPRERVERARNARVRMLSVLVLVLLVVTAVLYTAYVATAVGDESKVLAKVTSGYNVTSGGTNTVYAPANNTTTVFGNLPTGPYEAFSEASAIIDVIMVLVLVAVTAMVLFFPPKGKKDPKRPLDALYANLLFGLVFWPVAALGTWIGTTYPAIMLGLGFLPALVIAVFLARLIDEGTGPIWLFLVIMGAMAALMITTILLWGAFLTGGGLVAVIIGEILPILLYFGLAFLGRDAEPILRRPLVGELLMWGGIGIVLGTVLGVIASGSFGGAGTPIVSATAIFSGSTYLVAPYLSWAGLTSSSSAITVALPALFGVLGFVAAVLTLPPLLDVGDLVHLQEGITVADECKVCHKDYVVLASRNVGLCSKHRIAPAIANSRPQDAGLSASPPN